MCLNDKLHSLFLKTAVAQRPDYFICMTATVGFVPFITVGDCLSIFQRFFRIVFLNGFVKVPSVSTGENT